jgi:hypothetical protein
MHDIPCFHLPGYGIRLYVHSMFVISIQLYLLFLVRFESGRRHWQVFSGDLGDLLFTSLSQTQQHHHHCHNLCP